MPPKEHSFKQCLSCKACLVWKECQQIQQMLSGPSDDACLDCALLMRLCGWWEVDSSHWEKFPGSVCLFVQVVLPTVASILIADCPLGKCEIEGWMWKDGVWLDDADVVYTWFGEEIELLGLRLL